MKKKNKLDNQKKKKKKKNNAKKFENAKQRCDNFTVFCYLIFFGFFQHV